MDAGHQHAINPVHSPNIEIFNHQFHPYRT
jgi:hypothetical protein